MNLFLSSLTLVLVLLTDHLVAGDSNEDAREDLDQQIDQEELIAGVEYYDEEETIDTRGARGVQIGTNNGNNNGIGNNGNNGYYNNYNYNGQPQRPRPSGGGNNNFYYYNGRPQRPRPTGGNGNNYYYSGRPQRPQPTGGRPQNYGYDVPMQRPKRQCTLTGMPCTNGTVCCSDVCEEMPKPGQPRRCCLSEGLICDNSSPGNRGLLPCCNGLFCDQLASVPQLTVCQERTYKFENGKK